MKKILRFVIVAVIVLPCVYALPACASEKDKLTLR